MPVYTYECKNCGQRFDAKQSFSDAPLTTCPNCNGEVFRIIQPAAVVFKGSGFYVTDSKGKQNLATTSNGKKEETKTSEGASTETSSGTSDNGTSTKSTETPAKPAAETKSTGDSNKAS